MIEYFNLNSFDLLQSIVIYLRKQLKIPEYTMMFEDEEFKMEDYEKETEALFQSNPMLLTKLEKLKNNIIAKIFNIIDVKGSEVQVSLLVYTGFKTLVSSEIKEWRSLEMLRESKSSFNPQLMWEVL